jgi:single-stranded-DNA-specific exonuclease
MTPSIGAIDDPDGIPDMGKAVARIAKAIVDEEHIVFAVDHDMDGTASAAVLWSAFVDHFGVNPALLKVVTSHRLTEGYGITEPVAQRIIQSDATLVISADKGSSDEPRIAQIAAANKDVVVTDHHAIPAEGPPRHAYAVVNPTRKDSNYDPFVCGAGVAFLTMAKVRSELLRIGHRSSIPTLSALLDYVAVATIADCVALRPDKSFINRAFVKRGLALINATTRPCWKVFNTHCSSGPIHSEQIAFQLAPAIAAAGRLDWAETGFRFLISSTESEAAKHWAVLQEENARRKKIERALTEKAIEAARSETGQTIVLYFEDGHSGVHGITASRVVEAFGKPAALFSPKGAGARKGEILLQQLAGTALISGSFRGVPGFHVRDALQHVADNYPSLLAGFGGHAGAAGATLALADLPTFTSAYEEAARSQLGDAVLAPITMVDGDLDPTLLTLETLDELHSMGPWGKDFPFPIFCSEFRLVHQSAIGDGTHLKLTLERDGQTFSGIWFSAISKDGDAPNLVIGQTARLAYRLQDNWYKGSRTMQLNIVQADSSNG